MGNINEERDMRFAYTHLLAAAMVVSPTSVEQVAFGNLVSRLEREGKTGREIVYLLANAIADGVQLGDWPKE